jgi:hypothetical protein
LFDHPCDALLGSTQRFDEHFTINKIKYVVVINAMKHANGK